MKLLSIFIVFMLTFAQAVKSVEARVFEQALPGYKYAFPRDHASHPQYKTEWWYYTGHLKTDDNKDYGYELTFFRKAFENADMKNKSVWTVKDFHLAHFAISDASHKKFYFNEKLNRTGIGVAGARDDRFYSFNEGWSMEDLGGKFLVRADTKDFGIHLVLDSTKPPVIHGIDGVSRKAPCKGCSSHYYSMTRLKTTGNLIINGVPVPVTGLTWMDHEFGSNQMSEDEVGWDWFSIQLSDSTELMLYLMRKKDGTIEPVSSGTLIHADGSSKHLVLSDFTVHSRGSWKSGATGGVYPMGWDISLPASKTELRITPLFENQELVTKRSDGITYWEGACNVLGNVGGSPISGKSYVELTGYAGKLKNNI